VPETPYFFSSSLLVIGKTNGCFDNLLLHISTEHDGKVLDEMSYDLSPGQNRVEQNVIMPAIFLRKDINIFIRSFGAIKISLLENSQEIFSGEYGIVGGEGSYYRVGERIPTSKIFSGKESGDIDFVRNLLRGANKSLKIFDNYLDLITLEQLLKYVPREVPIKILTKSSGKIKSSSLPHFISFEVRSSVSSHDRFVIINDSEYYHFGHSLKDVAKGKISYFSKIINLEDVKKLDLFWNTEWWDRMI